MNCAAPAAPRLDWQAMKLHVDLARVATALWGPAPLRKGKRLLWTCPFHDDKHPSFQVDVERQTWRCWPCGIGGDAIDLVKRLRNVEFREAVRIVGELSGIALISTPSRKWELSRVGATHQSQASSSGGLHPPYKTSMTCKLTKHEPDEPAGLPLKDALLLVEQAESRLWTPVGTGTREYLDRRGLSAETTRSAHLGYVASAYVPTRDGDRYFRTSGVTIPWFEGGRLALVKVRQPVGSRPKYIEAFRDRPRIFPGFEEIEQDLPLVIVEGEFDALVLGQDLHRSPGLPAWASVITLGSASNRPDPQVLAKLMGVSHWYLALDADEAGDKAASQWSEGAIRVRPPEGLKDWTELKQSGPDRPRQFWARYLGS